MVKSEFTCYFKTQARAKSIVQVEEPLPSKCKALEFKPQY
jgi:hypothetical protein